MAGGRPPKYKSEFAEQAYKLCLLGATDKELAGFFEVEEKTVNNWKAAHPEFLQALKSGKVEADTNVANRLYMRANGYEYQEKTYERIENMVVTPEGDVQAVPGTRIKTVVKQMAPDVTAQIFWLKNRQKNKWRDKHEVEATNVNYDMTEEEAREYLRQHGLLEE